MGDLAEWLTQIWDEQEKIARAATAGPWRYNSNKHTHLPGSALFEEAVFAGPAGKDAIAIAATGETDDPQSMADARFIARHDPASALVRIAADRQILEIHEPDPRDPEVCTTCGEPLEYTVAWSCQTVRTLALPYADRPGYQEAWKP